MQFYCRNAFTFFALALALVCILELAPGAKATCTADQLREKAKGICNSLVFAFTPCKHIVEHFLKAFEAICPPPNNDKASSSISTTTAASAGP